MEWLAFAVALVSAIYFAIHYPRFRRALGYIGLAFIALVAVASASMWYQNQQDAALRRAARTVIKSDQLQISEATLALGSLSEFRATVTNRSPHALRELAIKVTVTDCPGGSFSALHGASQPARICTIIGEYLARTYVDVPSGQKRAINPYVSFQNMPRVREGEWSWHYSIQDVVAKY